MCPRKATHCLQKLSPLAKWRQNLSGVFIPMKGNFCLIWLFMIFHSFVSLVRILSLEIYCYYLPIQICEELDKLLLLGSFLCDSASSPSPENKNKHTSFELITAHTPLSAQSSKFVVFRLQAMYLICYKKHTLWVPIWIASTSRCNSNEFP